MKTTITIVIAVIATIPLFSQVPLTTSTNTLRHGDILCKIEVPYVEQGEKGNDAVWRFPSIPADGTEHLQTINSNGDTIVIYEEGMMRHFLVRNDTLYDKGTQSRRAHKIYSQERPVMHYPFGYGDRIEGSFMGEGRYEMLTYTVTGSGYTVADGTGMLTDGEDTLRHVTRLHMHDEYTLDYGGEPSPRHLAEDRYLWYCAGSRYPVLETWQLSLREGGALALLDSTAYLYLPVMQQEDLEEDPENDRLLADLDAEDAAARASAQQAGPFTPIRSSLSSDGTSLTLSYELDTDTPLHILASDIPGNLLGSIHYASRPAGTWEDHLTLSHRPVGGVVAIYVECGMQNQMMKVTSNER